MKKEKYQEKKEDIMTKNKPPYLLTIPLLLVQIWIPHIHLLMISSLHSNTTNAENTDCRIFPDLQNFFSNKDENH